MVDISIIIIFMCLLALNIVLAIMIINHKLINLNFKHILIHKHNKK